MGDPCKFVVESSGKLYRLVLDKSPHQADAELLLFGHQPAAFNKLSKCSHLSVPLVLNPLGPFDLPRAII